MLSMSSSPACEQRPRPPTPPKEHSNDIDDALNFLNADGTTDKAPTTLLQGTETPPQPSPRSSQNDSSQRAVKKVEFCPWPVNHDVATEKRPVLGLRRLPSLNDQRPLKSILKSSAEHLLTPDESSPAPTGYFSPEKPQDFPKMLESVIKLLAAPTITMRMDGYRTINGALKAYDDLPDREALKSKMPQLSHFIMRDLCPITDDPMNTTMTTQALKLSTALVVSRMSASLGEDFEAKLVDKAIDVLGQEEVIKAVANHYMYLLAYQKFSPTVMTPTRVDQLVQRLNTIDKKITGNTVIATRMVIYRRLIDQSPSVMLSKIRDWLSNVFHGVLSSTKDIRQRAVECGIQAGLALGSHYSATKAMIDLFNSEVKNGGTYGDYLMARLYDTITRKEHSEVVPPIWSMVVLFFRSRKRPIYQWQMFKSWLLVIQRCLNSSDGPTKAEALIAWNRLVFVVDLDGHIANPTQKIVSMLNVPLMAIFDKKEHDDHSRYSRRVAMSGYCNLLYYALRPSQAHQDLDVYWKEYVAGVLPKLFKNQGKDAKFAARVLKALFRGNGDVWNPNRANEATPTCPEDLPRLDPTWVRSRLLKILQLIEPYLATNLWLSGQAHGMEATPWRELMTAVADAGRQEVRSSMESREAMAHLMNFFGKLWAGASKAFTEQADGMWITKFGDLLSNTIQSLGPFRFVEDSLTRNRSDLLEPAPTPSHRPSKHHPALQSPVVYLFSLFKQPPVTVLAGDAYFDVIRRTLQSLYAARTSRKPRLELIRQCLPAQDLVPTGEIEMSVAASLWEIVAQETAMVMTDRTMDESVQESQQMWQQARHVISLLVAGLAYQAYKPSISASGLHLYTTACRKIRTDAGDGAVVLGLMEPFAEALLQAASTTSALAMMQYTSLILQQSVWPRNRQSLDDARKKLWGHQHANQKQAIFEPFDHVYALINKVCPLAYHNQQCHAALGSFSAALQGFISVCPPSQAATTLRKMQPGIAVLVADADDIFVGKSDESKETAQKIAALWKSALALIKTGPISGLLLKALSDVISAGFSSTRRSIVNATVLMWNESFGQLESLEYPPKIETILRQLRQVVEIELPTFPPKADHDETTSDLPFMSMEDGNSSQEELTPMAERHATPKPLQPALASTGAGLFTGVVSPAAALRSGSSVTPKARLRHNDSQIQFVAVESSPLVAEAGESQNLTEHQKEMMEKQRTEAARMYPDFSSSPLPWSAAPGMASTGRAGSMSRLDFAPQRQDGRGAFGTPEPVQEEHGPMDDFLGSSPTPRTAEKPRSRPEAFVLDARPARKDLLRGFADYDQDMPSSPPEMEEEAVDAGRPNSPKKEEAEANSVYDPVDVIDTVEENSVDGDVQPAALPDEDAQPSQPIQGANAGEHELKAVEQEMATTENGSEPEAPAETNAFETAPESLAVYDMEPVHSDADVEGTTEVPTGWGECQEGIHSSQGSSPIHFAESAENMATAETDTHANTRIKEELAGQDDVLEGLEDSRIEDTFAGKGTDSVYESQTTPTPVAEAVPSSQTSTISTRKRKRASTSTPSSAKRRKPTSPIKKLFSRIFSQSQQEDEDIEDCIVVNTQPREGTPSQASSSQQEVENSTPTDSNAPKAKRGRGRPRKSATPVSSSPLEASQPRSLKRRASALGDAGEPAMTDETMVTETPAPAKTRRQRKSQDTKAAKEAQRQAQVEAAEVNTPAPRHEMDAVVVPATVLNREDYELQESDNESVISPDKQLLQEQAAASQCSQSIAQPTKSLFGRLRDMIKEVAGRAFSSQEEREFHDGIHELSWASREARNRGLAQGLP